MRPIVKYAGRELTGPSEWTVSFDLVAEPAPVQRYWCRFRTDSGEPDVNATHFWGYVAYLGGRFIENEQFFDKVSGQIFAPIEEAAERARTSLLGMAEPRVGQVCWRFGSPPYDGDTSDDASQPKSSGGQFGAPKGLIKSTRVFAGVDGVQYQSQAEPGSPEEERLQGIQFELAGKSTVGSHEAIAHLFLADQMDGPSIIGLWAPAVQEAEADSRLAAAGFEIGS